MQSFRNAISNPAGLFSNRQISATPPPQFGTIGRPDNLPFTFNFSAGWIFGCYFAAVQDSILIDHSFKGFATSVAANVRAGVYTKTGADSGDDLFLSADVLQLNTGADQVLTFTQNKPLLAGTEYWFLIQADQDITVPYDNVAINQYTALFGYPFGGYPANYSGAFLNLNIIQTWGTYQY